MPTSLDPAHLFGREALRAQISAAWQAGARWITLVGPPGVGKTRMAQTLGGCFVDLIGATSGIEVIERIAGALGVPLGGLDATAGYARLKPAVQAQPLIVLDNLEQLPAGWSAVLDPLRAGPRWLGTSRRALGWRDEVRIFVDGLDADAATALFRARAWAAGAPLSAATADAITALARRLDGVPLALELAAARAPLLGILGLHAALDRDPGLIDSAADGLHTALSASWRLLPADQRPDLVALAVCEGPITPAGAAALWQTTESDALDRLDALRAGSWLRPLPGASQFRLYVGVRAFLLACESQPAARARWRAWLGEQAEALWWAQFRRPPSAVLDAIAVIAPDLRALLADAAAEPVAAGWAALALQAMMDARGPWHPQITHLDAALAFDLPDALRVLVLGTRGLYRGLRGEYALAEADLEAALEWAHATRRPDRIAWVLGGLGPVRRFLGRVDEAEALAREELRLAEEHALAREQARAAFNLAGALTLQQPPDVYPEEADRLWRQARRIGLRIGDRRLAAVCLANLAVIAIRAQRLQLAEPRLTAAIEELACLEMPGMLAKVWVERVKLALAQADLAVARQQIDAAREAADRLHDIELQVDMRIALAQWTAQADPGAADAAWQEAALFAAAFDEPALAERVQQARPAPARRAEDGFFTADDEWVDLRGRPVLRRVLCALNTSRAPLSVPDLVEAAWPDERILPEAAASRVYTAIRALRRLGAPIETVPGEGYSSPFSQRSAVPKRA